MPKRMGKEDNLRSTILATACGQNAATRMPDKALDCAIVGIFDTVQFCRQPKEEEEEEDG